MIQRIDNPVLKLREGEKNSWQRKRVIGIVIGKMIGIVAVIEIEIRALPV